MTRLAGASAVNSIRIAGMVQPDYKTTGVRKG
jgi:hypothetical protein